MRYTKKNNDEQFSIKEYLPTLAKKQKERKNRKKMKCIPNMTWFFIRVTDICLSITLAMIKPQLSPMLL